MTRSRQQLRRDVRQIWQAGVDAVRPERLIPEVVRHEGRSLWIGDEEIDLEAIDHIEVVGAGKAGAAMAAALETALGPQLLVDKDVRGWVNVPADCVRPLDRIHLHAGRPAGVNMPTAEGVAGSEKILTRVAALGPRDLCLCLISGGGSALLPAPVSAISLADKLAVTEHLHEAGANIEELNTVRKALSRIKGGGLARASRAGRLIALIISDVIGDPLELIASGPTVASPSPRGEALAILERYDARRAGISAAVFDYLAGGATSDSSADSDNQDAHTDATPSGVVTNLIIGNNAVALDAAGLEAVRLGYAHVAHGAKEMEGAAEHVGRHLAEMAVRMSRQPGPDCLITGGEPVVQLVDAAERGLGGRNMQLVLAAGQWLLEHAGQKLAAAEAGAGVCLLSGGTDGEDGPTDAAGAWLDDELLRRAAELGLDVGDFLRRNDAYRFFAPLEALLLTGPTNTNVGDIRVALVARVQETSPPN
ncbi:MAG: DUF4147 domain-containing protein [Planctomycetota bacterium]|nr:MAG: DUF4147 domain-containing protein [Planctomycetota bacterium]REK49443.1 MAG: DUF4147 domain-containing protein [Planctomycetota bacterium]